MDHRRRINKVQILRKFLFLDGSLTCLRLRVHFGKSGIVESVYGRLEMEPIQKKYRLFLLSFIKKVCELHYEGDSSFFTLGRCRDFT